MGVAREGSGVGQLTSRRARESVGHLCNEGIVIVSYLSLSTSWIVEPTFVLALRHLVSPHAHASIAIVSQSGGALVSGGLAVPAVPEHVALVLIGEDAVQARAVGGGNWGLCSMGI